MQIKNKNFSKYTMFFLLLFILIGLFQIGFVQGVLTPSQHLSVTINLKPYSQIYEGDIINCTIKGDPSEVYWSINNFSKHYTFYKNNPIIFNPEQTPLQHQYVNLSVHAKNSNQHASATIQIELKKIFFGDIHWHTTFSEGDFDIDTMYKNAILDNYLDFAASTDHGNMNDPLSHISFPFNPDRINTPFLKDPWDIIKTKTDQYYQPGQFTTLLGYEWSASNIFPGGYKVSPHGSEDVGHINFYYRDVYPEAKKFSMFQKMNYDEIFRAMSDEQKNGHRNIGYVHHPQGKIYLFGSTLVKYPYLINIPFFQQFVYDFTTNFSFLANKMNNKEERDRIFRGVEIYSRWGLAVGPYSNVSPSWPYYLDDPVNVIVGANKTDAWVENGMWEWSENVCKYNQFNMQMGGETHHCNRPGSAFIWRGKPAGIMAAYAVHNSRKEIWDAMDKGDIYGSQLLKIRGNVRFDGNMVLGSWMNCSNPLSIRVSAMSTFSGTDAGGRLMKPHNYPSNDLNHTISDIWLIKKDRDKGRPWCKIIGHVQPDKSIAVAYFQDKDVQKNDFYYIAIRQEGAELVEGQNQYTAFLGPVFIDQVEKSQ